MAAVAMERARVVALLRKWAKRDGFYRLDTSLGLAAFHIERGEDEWGEASVYKEKR